MKSSLKINHMFSPKNKLRTQNFLTKTKTFQSLPSFYTQSSLVNTDRYQLDIVGLNSMNGLYSGTSLPCGAGLCANLELLEKTPVGGGGHTCIPKVLVLTHHLFPSLASSESQKTINQKLV